MVKSLFFIALLVAMAVCGGCTSRKAAASQLSTEQRKDSMVTISKSEYARLQSLCDSTHITITRVTYDSLVFKTESLQHLCDILYKKIGLQTIREVQDPRLIPTKDKY